MLKQGIILLCTLYGSKQISQVRMEHTLQKIITIQSKDCVYSAITIYYWIQKILTLELFCDLTNISSAGYWTEWNDFFKCMQSLKGSVNTLQVGCIHQKEIKHFKQQSLNDIQILFANTFFFGFLYCGHVTSTQHCEIDGQGKLWCCWAAANHPLVAAL